MRFISSFLGLLFLLAVNTAQAAQGYRYMHVSIDTPWTIFIFLLVIVLFPFLLMAILYWYFAIKSVKESEKERMIEEAEQENSASSATNGVD